MGNYDVNWVEVYISKYEYEAKDEVYWEKRKIRYLDLALYKRKFL